MIDVPDIDALRRIGLSTAMARVLLREAPDPGLPQQVQPMRLIEVQRDHLLLHDGQHTHAARATRGLAEALAQGGDGLAVGDWLLARPAPPGHQHALVDQLLPRHSELARRTNDGRGGLKRQVLVSNVDTAFIVMGLDHDFNLRRLERYLALVRLADVAAVLLLSKADLVDAGQRERRLAQARAVLPPDMESLCLDGRSPAEAARLAPWLGTGQTLVLLGSSGAGKSTLTNTLTAALQGRAQQHTAAVRAGDGRGRHTTTVRTLHCSPAGACIIDTPGLRALRLDADDAGDLAQGFGDVARWSAQCRFRNCQHQQEPGCAVREAVPQARLRNYQKLLREAERDQLGVLRRQQQLAEWKLRSRAARARQQAKQSS